ncbi:MAG: VOC family protein [Candidatus Tectomicrobia bacterium]|nr:VOC family protein [Candidatus Tectomicrobia bacterium]
MDDRYKRHGANSWVELSTTDVKAATAFYSQLFGWSTEEMPMQDGAYTVVKTGSDGIGGIMPKPPQMQGLPCWGVYITVDDVDATAAQAQQLGATTIVPLTDIPNVGRFYTFQDPQGAVISAITYSDM